MDDMIGSIGMIKMGTHGTGDGTALYTLSSSQTVKINLPAAARSSIFYDYIAVFISKRRSAHRAQTSGVYTYIYQ
eukprot:SAG31_NODE_41319_length_276_cov_1.440678_1_plen_74_part_10